MNKKLLLASALLILSITFAFFAMDSRLSVVHYSVGNQKGGEPFRIALITDLHCCSYGEEQSTLLEAVRAENPDMVLFGGDIFDHRREWSPSLKVLETLGTEYDCYFVMGNHEFGTKKAGEIEEIVRGCGITLLDGMNSKFAVSAISSTPDIYGFDDPVNYPDSGEMLRHIEEATGNYHWENSYNILLAHRPEFFESYAGMGFDLVLCGHAHGGQWRIPGLINGIYAPGQGFFPEYAGGLFEKEGTTMIVSRGLAKESSALPRIFNRPELVIIDVE